MDTGAFEQSIVQISMFFHCSLIELYRAPVCEIMALIEIINKSR